MTPATRRSEFELSVLVAVPVLLGSLMRIPLGVLTDRYGGRRVFLAPLAFTPGPLVGLALWHESYAGLLALGLLLGFAGASFAVGVPFVSRWYPPGRQGFALGVYGAGMGGTMLGGSPRRGWRTRGAWRRRSGWPPGSSP